MASRDTTSRPEESLRAGAASGEVRAPPGAPGASASELAAMLDGVGTGVVAVDRQWRVTFINAWMERVLGRSRGEVLGRDLWTAFPLLGPTSFADVYRRAMRDGVEVVHEDFVASSNAWFEVRVSPSSTGLLIFLRDVTERRRAADALKAHEDQLRLILAAGGLGYWQLELATGRLQSPEGCKANFGLPPEADLSSYEVLRSLIHPEDRDSMAAAVERCLSSSEGYAADYRVLPPGGGTRWVSVRGRKVTAAGGTVQALAGITLDITGRKAVEEALRESEARFRNMADNAPVMLWMTDATGYCIWLNRQWHDFTGQTEEEGRGLGWLFAVHPDDRALAGDAFLSSNASRAPFRVEYRIRGRDGEYRWAIDSATPRYGASGEFLGYIGSVIDIHERKRGEERGAFMSEASRLLSESLDYEATLARTAQLAVPVLSDWCMVDVVQDGGGFKRVEVACADPALEPLARQALHFHEAQQAVRVREEFLQVASHELKTPLTPLSLKLQVLARSAESLPREHWPRVADDIGVMRQQVRRLSLLVDELLDVSRISSGRFSLHLEPVDLSALVRETASRFEPEVLRLGGRLDVEAPDRLEGAWDRQRLEQVVTNLLSNALKYGDGRPVSVRVEPAGSRVRLVVRDEGIGIAPEALRRIFDKFERAVSERHYGGLGLGLYITRQIVDALGGTIHVESAPGQGSTFIVELPLAPPSPLGLVGARPAGPGT